jgi:hypothetical protein
MIQFVCFSLDSAVFGAVSLSDIPSPRKSGILARVPGQGCPGYGFSFMVVRFGAW